MESVLGRYRNLIVLVGVLFLQVLGLAMQVRRDTETDSSRLIRVWAVTAVAPLEKALVWVQTSSGNLWHNYFYLRGVRAENRELRQQIEQMRIEQVRMSQDADQARRLQALLGFKEQFISQTRAAQVIGASGSEQSRAIYIDKGEDAGIKTDMAVITAEGVVGKILRVYGSTSQVLLISDQSSGVGAILEKSRLQGILRGTPSGEVGLEKVMGDEQVPVGEMVLTSGGDRIFPKGLTLGRVMTVTPGNDLFLNIRVKPTANLSKLEEVLVVTKIDEKQATPDQTVSMRAADILAERLPSVPPPKVPDSANGTGSTPAQAPAGSEIKPGQFKPKTMLPGQVGTSPAPAAQKLPTTGLTAGHSDSSARAGSTTVPVTRKPAPATVREEPSASGSSATKASPEPSKPSEAQPQQSPQDNPQ